MSLKQKCRLNIIYNHFFIWDSPLYILSIYVTNNMELYAQYSFMLIINSV